MFGNHHLLTIGLVNTRSAKQQDKTINKPTEIHDLIADNILDARVKVETWFRTGNFDKVAMHDITPGGYQLKHIPRNNRRGGGIAIIHRSCLTVTSLESASDTTFECFTTTIKHQKASIVLACYLQTTTVLLYTVYV